MGKKKKALAAKATATIADRLARRAAREAKRNAKKEHRKRDRKMYTADQWAIPAPQHLVAKLDVPKHSSKYQSYFEFAENTEKKDKKLEFKITNDANPPPGFVFVPIGDPALTNACKELSRDRDAMIFIVSSSKEENSKISEHMYRTGYHFREVIVDEAREIVGETMVSKITGFGVVEPIPDSQDEINKQADGAIRDLFPRIPHTDRTMIIEHAFKKGALFHGEPTVGLQSNIPLSRRVQLAVLAHIRHTHTRYDKLLRETSWMNARKAVEPVCLDVLVKWRGDEETGRDQMDEILREVVIITDSEEDEDSSEEDESSEEEGEVTSASSAEAPSLPNSRNQRRSAQPQRTSLGPWPVAGSSVPGDAMDLMSISSRTRTKAKPKVQKDTKAQRGFKRYQAAWDEALHRRQDLNHPSAATKANSPFEGSAIRRPRSNVASPLREPSQYSMQGGLKRLADVETSNQARRYYPEDSMEIVRSDSHYSKNRPAAPMLMHRDEVIVRPLSERPVYYQDAPQRLGTPSYQLREQRPPLVVRGSPTGHGLQDMLVPSIETASSDVATSPRLNGRHGVHGRFDHPQDLYPQQMVDRRVLSPPRRQVIVIDDSPQPKRRRVVLEDDSSHFRSISSRDHNVYNAAPYAESHIMPASSIQPGDFFVRRSRLPSQSTQGMFRDMQPAERISIYDAPEPGFFTLPPDHLRTNSDIVSGHHEGRHIGRRLRSPKPNESASESTFRRPIETNHNVMMAERDRNIRQVDPERSPSPSFHVSERISRSYEMNPTPEVTDQAFIQPFSQSRLEPALPEARDGFIILPQRPHQSFASRGIVPQRHEDKSNRAFPTVHPVRARSPARYIERPVQYTHESRLPVFCGHSPYPSEHRIVVERQPPNLREEPPYLREGNKPTYGRSVQPGPQIIVLE